MVEESDEQRPIFQKNVYWKRGDEKDILDGPYCTRCWDKERYWMRLKPISPPVYECPECKNRFRVEETK